MKKILFLIVFIFSFNSFACEYSSSNKAMKAWLGKNSNFSKSFTKGKCALDKVLDALPLEERKVIVNLIAKSYAFDEKNLNSLKKYNY